MSIHSLITATLVSGALTATSGAVGIFGIGANNNLYSFDSASPGLVTQIGANGSFSNIVDIDFHGANGLLYGVSGTGQAFTINVQTGVQTLVTTPGTALSGITAIDFNPLADRIRLAGTGNFNGRLTPDVQTPPTATQANGTVTLDGTYAYFAADGTTVRSGVNVLGAGYTNPSNNPSGTALYTLSSDGFLNLHTAPTGTFGNGVAVGALGFTPVGSAFDIDIAGLGYAYDGANLRTITLATGASASLGAIGLPGGTGLRGLAVVPEPSALLLSGLAGLGLLRRRRPN